MVHFTPRSISQPTTLAVSWLSKAAFAEHASSVLSEELVKTESLNGVIMSMGVEPRMTMDS